MLLHHAILGLPHFRVPCGFQSIVWRAMFLSPRLSVWATHCQRLLLMLVLIAINLCWWLSQANTPSESSSDTCRRRFALSLLIFLLQQQHCIRIQKLPALVTTKITHIACDTYSTYSTNKTYDLRLLPTFAGVLREIFVRVPVSIKPQQL